MASKIKIKRSAVAGKVPLTTDLELSELAVNTNDGRLYTKKDDGTESIVEIGGPDFGSRNVITTGTVTGASIIPTSSTVPTNGVYLPAANSVAIATNSNARLTIDSSGNVAIPGGLTRGGNNVVTVGDTGTVTSTMIADGTIVDADVNASAAIAPSKIAGTAVVDNDARLTDTRTPTDGSVTNVKVAANAGIDPTKIAGTAVITSDSRLTDTRTPSDGSVTNAKVADNAAIAYSKLALTGTIVDGDIASAAGIAPSKIAGTAVVTSDSRLTDNRTPIDGSVTTTKLAAGAVTAAKASIASQAQAEAGTDSTTLMTPQRVAQALTALAGVSQVVTTTFTSSGTFTKNADDIFYLVYIVGGGASGSRVSSGAPNGGPGGGGNIRVFLPADLSTNTTVVVGAGGAGLSTNGTNPGGDSSFGIYKATGGGNNGSLTTGGFPGTTERALGITGTAFDGGSSNRTTNEAFTANSVFGGGAGGWDQSSTYPWGTSVWAGRGATNSSPTAGIPGGGGHGGDGVTSGAGARGEVRVYAIRKK